ncbi:MAG: hypothetical protein ACK4UJ_04460 [Leptonema sp. (in: bacteria)]
MDEFTPETLEKYISSQRINRNTEEILSRIQQKKKETQEEIPQKIAEMDSQIRNFLAEIIRECLRKNRKELLKKILSEHKNFIDNILNTLS